MARIESLDKDFVSQPRAVTAESAMCFSRFVTRCLAVAAVGALTVMAFVAVVDPYHLFGMVDAEGFNRIKPLPERYRAQIKVARAVAVQPKALLLGNSRIEVGFDPESGPLSVHGYPTYNLGLAGTSLATSLQVFEQVRSKSAPLVMAVIGVDFLDFLVDPSAAASSTRPEQFESWRWRLDTLFSMKALADAVRTLLIQRTPEVETLTSHGYTPLLEYRKFARREGYHAIFEQRAREYAKSLVRKPHNLFVGGTGSSESINRLRDLLREMSEDGTEVHLIIYPYHAQLMALVEEAGLQGTMEEWKRMLVREVSELRSRQPGARVSLWDFSGYGAVQCERIPAPGDTRSTTEWYWEAGHFKWSVGELMLRRIFGEKADFGVRLTAGNLAWNRMRIVEERARCAKDNPEAFARAYSMTAEAHSGLR